MKMRQVAISSKVDERVALKVQRRVLDERRKQLDNPFIRQKPYTISDFVYEAVLEKLGSEEEQ
jgi:hypothetical protein